jgi:hypothetical protein
MTTIVQMLSSHSFQELFQHLGWDRAQAHAVARVDGQMLSFRAVAQKRGLAVLCCVTDRVNLVDRAFLRRAQRQLLRLFHEHIAIYTSEQPRKQVWQWAVRLLDGRKVRHREHPFFSAKPPPLFLARLAKLHFSLEEEENVTILEAMDRVRAALDTSAELEFFVKRPRLARVSDQLARQMHAGDKAAFHRLILLHRPLARRISRRLERWFGMDPDDAEQTAMIGLLMAARKFKPELGCQFSTYATHWIRQACQRLGPEFALPIHIPQHVFWRHFPIQLELRRLAERQAAEGAIAKVLSHVEKTTSWPRICSFFSGQLPSTLATIRKFNCAGVDSN